MSTTTPRPSRRPRDSGLTTTELLVALIIGAIIAGVGGWFVITSTRSSTVTQARHATQNELATASTQLVRDVSDGSRIRTAEATRLAVDVVRDGACQTRDWAVADDTLTVTTTFYDGATCTGGSDERVQDMVPFLTDADTVFTYYSTMAGENALVAPVDPLQVGRVGWTLVATPDHPDSVAASTVLRLESGAAFTPKGSSTDGGGTIQDAKSPILRVATADTGVEGIDKPVLSWTDLTPELTSGWAVFRIANPDGTTDTDPTRTTWTQLAFIPTATPAPATMSYTDTSLPAGYTAQYVVRAVIPSGNGPDSNQASTGLRPSSPTSISVDGADTSLNLTWPAAVGATGYDLYRSSGGAAEAGADTLTLYKRWSQIKAEVAVSGGNLTWTEAPGYGSSYSYTVVAVNRWEHLATDPLRKDQTREVATGTIVNARVNGTAVRHERLRPARDGDFTAPAAPSFTLALNSTSSATDYGTAVTWTPATWTGGGPLVVDGKSRDIWWTAKRGGVDVWTKSTTNPRTDTGTAADQTYAYAIATCNDSGCSPLAPSKRLLQRPAVPSCTAATSGLTTRQATVTSGTSSSATSWQTQKVTGPSSAAMGGVKDTNGSRQIIYDELGHSSAHTWQARSTNVAPSGVAGGGTSAWGGACGATTTPLAVTISDGWSDTRRIDLTLGATGGTAARIEVTRPGAGAGEDVGPQPGVGRHRWDPLVHGTVYQAYASNEDGYNTVYAGPVAVGTQTLATPGVSFGAVTTRSIQAFVSCANGSSCTVGRTANGGAGSGTTFDYLADGTSHGFYGVNSDGFNVVVSPVAYTSTNLLSVSTPTCTATSDGRYAPTTARFSSNGSLNRTSVAAPSAGRYTAVATMTNSDGYNTAVATSGCAVNVLANPVPAAPTGIQVVSYTPNQGAFLFPYVDSSVTSYTYQLRYKDSITGIYQTYPATTSPASEGSIALGRIGFTIYLPYSNSDGGTVSWSGFSGRGMVTNLAGASVWSAWTGA